MGDFNHPSIKWYDSTSPPDVDHPSTRFLEAVRDSFMSQHVTEPTHYRGNCTPNTLDLILTNEEVMVENVKYMAPVGKSHHSSLCFSFCCYTRSTSNRDSSYKYHKGGFDNMRKTVNAKDWEAMFQGKSLDQCWNTVKEEMRCVSEKFIPKYHTGRMAGKGKPMWTNQKTITAVEKKRHVYSIPQYSIMTKTMFSIGEHLIQLRLKSGKRYVTLRSILQLRLRLTQRYSSNMPGQN